MHSDESPERPSKSARKRESHALQDLGETLIKLPDELLAELPLPENLRDAVLAARRITSRGALVRQRQYIGKLMRKIDAQPIRAALEEHEERHRADARRFQRVENWRDRLLQEGEPAMREFMESHPDAEAAELARMVAEARNEHEAGRTPRAARVLFQKLRDLLA